MGCCYLQILEGHSGNEPAWALMGGHVQVLLLSLEKFCEPIGSLTGLIYGTSFHAA